MRYFQNLLLLIGSTSLGTVLGFYALAAVVAAIQQGPKGEPWQAGFGQYLGGMFCGLPLGALLGLAVGIGAMRGERWNGVVWLGIAAGLLSGPFVSDRLNIDQAFGWWGVAVMVVASGTLGGAIAGASLAIRDAVETR